MMLLASLSYSQTPYNELIDSLNLTNDLEKRIELSQQIALQIKDTDWNRAITYIELAESEAKKTKNPNIYLAAIYTSIAKMYFSKDVVDVALDYYQKAHTIYKEQNNLPELSKTENNLAIIYAQGNNEKKALKYFQNVYAYQEKKNDSVQLVKILNNMGTIYLNSYIDSSLYYYKKAHIIANKINDNLIKAYVYTNLGRAYYTKKDSLKAKQYFNKAILSTKLPIENAVKAFIFKTVAEYFYLNKQNDSAIFYASKSFSLNEANFYNFLNQNTASILYKAHINIEDYKKAVYYFEKYNNIRDSLNVEEKAVNVERLKLEQEYKTRSKIQSLNEEKKRFKYYVIGLILVIGILILLILLIKYRNRIIKNRLEKTILKARQQELKQNLDAKNKVLIGKAMTEMHRTDIIKDILKDLKQIKLKAIKKETQQAIELILRRLQKDLNTDIWQEFEVSFEQVHKSFYDELNKNHPDLTPRDRRLCSLLYLDLTTKEISQITGQSFKSVENSRTRLRKKLNLTNEKVNLSTYLNSLSLS